MTLIYIIFSAIRIKASLAWVLIRARWWCAQRTDYSLFNKHHFPFYNIFGVRLLGTRLWQSSELIDQARDYVQGAIFPVAFFAEGQSDGLQGFVQLYRDNFESEPTDLAANGYDTIRLLKAVMNDGDGVHTRRGLQRRLILYDGFDGVTGKISFDEQGEVEKSPTLLTISNRRFRETSTTP